MSYFYQDDIGYQALSYKINSLRFIFVRAPIDRNFHWQRAITHCFLVVLIKQ